MKHKKAVVIPAFVLITCVFCGVLHFRLGSGKTGGEFPASYDYRTAGRAPAVKDQGKLNTCWAFASLTAIESTLLPGEDLEFSEDHMSLSNGFCMGQAAGGDYTMSMAYLLSWRGPVLGQEDPYGDGQSPAGLNAAKHVQEIQLLPEKDYRKIKEAVYRRGGVQSSLYTTMTDRGASSAYYDPENYSYCYMGEDKPNHDSVIVGWDDHYPRERFRVLPPGDGAFICINSWGKAFGEDGYFYVSYYDANIGVTNLSYASIEPADNYDHIYQSDLRGWVGQIGYGEETVYVSNVYRAEGREMLKAVGFYATGPDTGYEVYAAAEAGGTGDFLKAGPVAVGKFENPGYYTVPLEQAVSLEAGSRFAVAVKITTPGAVHPAAVEYDAGDGRTRSDLSDGEGYVSLDGAMWERTEETQNCNVCLKAYTVEREK